MFFGALILITCICSATHIAPEDLDASLLPSYHYIIVGGGISGLVVANRLTEDLEVDVLLLEVGPLDRYEESIMVPKFIEDIVLYGTNQYYFNFTTTPQTFLDGATRTIPQGRVVGGGSVVNALVWQRGFKVDFDAWAALGNTGWGWDDLLPYFKKSETYTPPSAANAEEPDINYEADIHGEDGPIQVSFPNYIYKQSKNIYEGFNILGVPTAFDPADGTEPGANFLASSLHPTNQSRSDARRAYYDPYIARPNFHVATGQQVTRLLSTPGVNSQLNITGVEFATNSTANRKIATATREVILAAGPVHSPQLLQLSGIGPKDLLEGSDIPVLVDAPGVGQNIQDHFGVTCYYPYSNVVNYESPLLLDIDPIFNELRREEYYKSRTGQWTSGQLPEILAFTPLSLFTDNADAILSSAQNQSADRYLSANLDPTIIAGYSAQKDLIIGNLATNKTGAYELFHDNAGIMVSSVMHPFGRGYLAISSTDAFAQPVIDPRYGSNPLDIQIIVEALKFQRKFLATVPMTELLPVQILPAEFEDDDVLELIVKSGIKTEYHPSGTTSMLPAELGGVVDTHLLVYGTANLRVVDAGVFPLIPGCHIQAAVYAVAEKAADIIKANNV